MDTAHHVLIWKGRQRTLVAATWLYALLLLDQHRLDGCVHKGKRRANREK